MGTLSLVAPVCCFERPGFLSRNSRNFLIASSASRRVTWIKGAVHQQRLDREEANRYLGEAWVRIPVLGVLIVTGSEFLNHDAMDILEGQNKSQKRQAMLQF